MIEHKQAWENMVKAKDTIFETMMTIKITLVTHQEQVVKDQQDNKWYQLRNCTSTATMNEDVSAARRTQSKMLK